MTSRRPRHPGRRLVREAEPGAGKPGENPPGLNPVVGGDRPSDTRGVPLERIAVVYGSREPYARLVHEQLAVARIAHNGAVMVPFTTRIAGRALLGLVAPRYVLANLLVRVGCGDDTGPGNRDTVHCGRRSWLGASRVPLLTAPGTALPERSKAIGRRVHVCSPSPVEPASTGTWSCSTTESMRRHCGA